MINPKISVAVTTYKRPKMVEDIIKSFLFQTYKNSELVIVDDCIEDISTQEMVQKYMKIDPRIRFIKNKKNLGYSKNFLKSLMECSGEYILTLGDDDLLLQEKTLEYYVDIFEKYPDVGYIYSNIIQFNNQYEPDYIYNIFKEDTYFSDKEKIFQEIRLKSCYIPWIGLRNIKNFDELYPKDDRLFPQVEMIGKMLVNYNAYGISEYLIAGRAHNDQLGLYAVKWKRIKKTERHSSLELPEIFEIVKKYFKERWIILKLDKKFVNDFFRNSHATILPTEKINTWNVNVLRVFIKWLKANPKMLLDLRYLFYLIISLSFPASLLLKLKEWYKKKLINRYYSNEKKCFLQSIQKMHLFWCR